MRSRVFPPKPFAEHTTRRYYEAELAATRALTFNPMHLNVRYTRGNIRRMAKNYHGALAGASCLYVS